MIYQSFSLDLDFLFGINGISGNNPFGANLRAIIITSPINASLKYVNSNITFPFGNTSKIDLSDQKRPPKSKIIQLKILSTKFVIGCNIKSELLLDTTITLNMNSTITIM